MIEVLIRHVEAIERVLADLPLVAALVNDDRGDGAVDAAAEGLRDLLAVVSGLAIERAIREES